MKNPSEEVTNRRFFYSGEHGDAADESHFAENYDDDGSLVDHIHDRIDQVLGGLPPEHAAIMAETIFFGDEGAIPEVLPETTETDEGMPRMELRHSLPQDALVPNRPAARPAARPEAVRHLGMAETLKRYPEQSIRAITFGLLIGALGVLGIIQGKRLFEDLSEREALGAAYMPYTERIPEPIAEPIPIVEEIRDETGTLARNQ